MSKYTENFPNLSTYDFDTIMCQLKQVCGADQSGMINAQFLSRPTTAKDIALLLHITYELFQTQVELQKQFIELYTFVKDFFENLDLQEEVNNKLDEMLEDGTFEKIFPNFNLINQLCLWYPFIYTEQYDFSTLEGITGENVLMNWDINKMYALFDALLTSNDETTPYSFTSEVIGYASNELGQADMTLPIKVYHYIPARAKNKDTEPYKIILTSGIHGNEKSYVYMLYHFISQGIAQTKQKLINDMFTSISIDLIPIVNPYGFNACINANISELLDNLGRFNARGVDLNRNFSTNWNEYKGGQKGESALSELESQAIENYFEKIDWKNVRVVIDCHTTFPDFNNLSQHFGGCNSNDEVIQSYFCKSFRDNSQYTKNRYDMLIPSQYTNWIGRNNPSPQMIFQAIQHKGNEYGVALVEGAKIELRGKTNEYIFNGKNIMAINYNIFYTALFNIIKTRCNEFNNNYIENSTYGIAKLYNSVLPIDFDSWDTALYNQDDVTHPMTQTSQNIFLKNTNLIKGVRNKTVKAFIDNPDCDIIIYYINNDNSIDGSSGFIKTYNELINNYNTIGIGMRNHDNSNVLKCDLWNKFNIYLSISE